MFDVAASVTPRANSAANSVPRIIASAMSLTASSSKQITRACAAILSATSSSGFSRSRSAFRCSCTSAMKRWK